MKLRKWQAECVEQALQHYRSQPHFFCQATPGAGKSMMAAELAIRLYQTDTIDFILCFSPSVTIASGLARTFSDRFDLPFDGKLGAIGGAYTYQSMPHQDEEFWALLDRYKVFVVFDEIHHCAGSDLGNANKWGAEILAKIQHRAAYTLTLTGTPWRSDMRPIVLSPYGNNGITCDYTYGLQRAVAEGVCRKPNIVLIDNEKLVIHDTGNTQEFSGIEALLTGSNTAYRSILRNHNALKHCLKLGIEKLQQLRSNNAMAGGLVVASSVAHAKEIVALLRDAFGLSASLVTYQEANPQQIIETFRHSNQPWIVSVGMISEGTDIPRLQVCCHLSNVTTELYFRQVLGRGIRMTTDCDGETWLYTFAEPKIVDYANRIAEDLPEHRVLFTSRIEAAPSEKPRSASIVGEAISLDYLDVDCRISLAEPLFGPATSPTHKLAALPTLEFLGSFRNRLCGLILA
ncbi:DEAD/DEAH box helicase [Shewanella sp. FJAT-52076]|uniref:DEAD/DEAH box helicase n=1 Tax=Shewanella sp. FJAT-52076 TaxID=2864202 RepID=UPI001C65A2E1|nr:DEAD/DEAH box helicase family protein [Shewanella sp. FJAT-52076]QYJ75323.1 DEAD/DEAH box helicase family protein [Shewanella sp. FJAT-52076]